MKTYLILFNAEFKRFWTPVMIVIAFGIMAIGNIIVFSLGLTLQLQKISQLAEVCYSFVSFFSVLLFSAGIIGADIKSGWMRTLLIRSVTRQQYVLTKIAVVVCATLLTMLITILIPISYYAAAKTANISIDAVATMSLLLLKSGEITLFIIISTFISCWITGAFNSLALYIWIAGAQMIKMLIATRYWDVSWAMVMKDFLYPSGFQNALDTIKLGVLFPTADILWGVAATAFFLSLTLFSINKVQADISTE